VEIGITVGIEIEIMIEIEARIEVEIEDILEIEIEVGKEEIGIIGESIENILAEVREIMIHRKGRRKEAVIGRKEEIQEIEVIDLLVM